MPGVLLGEGVAPAFGRVELTRTTALRPGPGATRDVVLGFAHNGTVTTPFFQSCFEAVNYDSLRSKRISTMTMAQSPYIPDARSTICDRVLNEGAEWLWFVDTDVRFPPNALDMLLAVADPKERPIVGGSYLVRYDDGIHSVWLTVVPETQSLHPIHEVPDSGLVKVAAVGMGCTIIHRGVLEALAEEHADDSWRYFGHDLVRNGDRLIRTGEDVTFCMRARLLGFPCYGLADLKLDHYKFQPLTR